MTKILFIAFALLLLQGCASQDSVKKKTEKVPSRRLLPDSVQVVGSFIELKAENLNDSLEIRYLDSVRTGVDFIEFGKYGNGDVKGEYDVKLEKIQGDSSWFVWRTIRREMVYSDGPKFIPFLEWKQVKVDSIADTTAFLKIMDAMESFVPDTTMEKTALFFDASIPFLFYKKGSRLMWGNAKGGNAGLLWESPGLRALYRSINPL